MNGVISVGSGRMAGLPIPPSIFYKRSRVPQQIAPRGNKRARIAAYSSPPQPT